MCGINGIIKKNGRIKFSEIDSMNKAIAHRGPDDEGHFISNTNSISYGFGHRRLSILDLSPRGKQPMGLVVEKEEIVNDLNNLEKADYIIVFNGEIYNYLELKEKYNMKTQTTSDTEVLLRLYHKKGKDFLLELNGMWSFCILDKKEKILLCSRDIFGKKPFYYYHNKDLFVFSSELKGILSVVNKNKIKNIDKDAVRLYFSLGFIPSPFSIYKKVKKLPAGHALILDFNTFELENFCYYDIPIYEPIKDKKKIVQEVYKTLYNSVKIRSRSDVPVGAFLSGGIDSTSIVSLFKEVVNEKNIHTFSIGFPGKNDESDYILFASKFFSTKHHHDYFTKEDFLSLLNQYVYAFDEPFGDYAGFPTLKVSKNAKEYVTVVLSGDGGDEVFGGYENHRNAFRISLLKKIPLNLRKFVYSITPRSLYLIKTALAISIAQDEDFYNEMLKEFRYKPKIYKWLMRKKLREFMHYSRDDITNAVLLMDLFFLTIPDLFMTKVDRASMLYGLEVRSPFLDVEVVKITQKIPSFWKVDFFNTKKIFKEIASKFLPTKIIRRKKKGFHPPIDEWIFEINFDFENALKKLYRRKVIPKDVYIFYKQKVFPNKKKHIFRDYYVRLFLFYKWAEYWLLDFV